MNLIAHYLKQEKYCDKYEQNENFLLHTKRTAIREVCGLHISRVKKYTTKHPSATTMHRAETTSNS